MDQERVFGGPTILRILHSTSWFWETREALDHFIDLVDRVYREYDEQYKKAIDAGADNVTAEEEASQGVRPIHESILWSSLVVMTYAVFEDILKDLCRRAAERLKLTVTYSDRAGSPVKTSIRYLEKIANIEIPRNYESYREIEILRQVRNQIVHDARGEPGAAIVNYARIHPDRLSIGEAGTKVIPHAEYCRVCMAACEEFAKLLFVGAAPNANQPPNKRMEPTRGAS